MEVIQTPSYYSSKASDINGATRQIIKKKRGSLAGEPEEQDDEPAKPLFSMPAV